MTYHEIGPAISSSFIDIIKVRTLWDCRPKKQKKRRPISRLVILSHDDDLVGKVDVPGGAGRRIFWPRGSARGWCKAAWVPDTAPRARILESRNKEREKREKRNRREEGSNTPKAKGLSNLYIYNTCR